MQLQERGDKTIRCRNVWKFLFDIDGTLVDSSAVVVRVWREVAAEYGADAEAILGSCHGRLDTDVVAEFFRPQVGPAALRRVNELETAAINGVVAMQGAPELLAGLASADWAAVTSGPRPLMSGRLRACGLPVPEVFVTAEDVTVGKPDPQGFLLAARGLGVPATSCVVIEDSPAGVAAGKAAGALVVAVTSTHGAEALAAADIVIAGLPDLLLALPARAGL
jgi:sugar-phosphatase